MSSAFHLAFSYHCDLMLFQEYKVFSYTELPQYLQVFHKQLQPFVLSGMSCMLQLFFKHSSQTSRCDICRFLLNYFLQKTSYIQMLQGKYHLGFLCEVGQMLSSKQSEQCLLIQVPCTCSSDVVWYDAVYSLFLLIRKLLGTETRKFV